MLKNLDTGVTEMCFDDSDVGHSNNFNFMEVGKQYECKISLFGSLDKEGIELRYLDDVFVGLEKMSKVTMSTGDIYYIGSDDATGLSLEDSHINIGDSFNFCASRKDLVQVNDTVHGDCLKAE
jgi:hypothetical protein